MKYEFHTCDVFTDVRFGGNPLAVVLRADDLSGEQMQVIAREFNLSETVFVLTPNQSLHSARVRIFTPRIEMDFAGHPTVGCACLLAWLAHKGEANFVTEMTLEENAGLVPVQVVSEGCVLSAQLVAPDGAQIVGRNLDHALIASGLSLNLEDIGFEGHRPQAVSSAGTTRQFVPVKNLEALSRIQVAYPDYGTAETQAAARSTVAYTRGGVDEDSAFSMRNFGPANGNPEDPATGSAVTMLPEQIAEFENLGDGAHAWCVEQGYDMGRPSKLFLEADRQDGTFTEIRVAGGVVFISKGEIEV